MSLNDEAIDELHSEADYLTDDDVKKASLGTVRVTTEDELDVKLPKDIDALVASLANYDVEIQTTKDEITKVYELDDLANSLMVQESISQSDAEEVERVYGGLYDNVAGLNEYTQVPSGVNLKETKAYVLDKREEVVSEAIARHREYLTKTYHHAVCLLDCLNKQLLPETLEELDAVRLKSTSDLLKASVSSNFLVYTKEEKNDKGEVTGSPRLVDLKSIRLLNDVKERFDLPESLQSLPSEDDIVKLREVFHSHVFRRLTTEANVFTDVLESLHRDYHGHGHDREAFYDLSYIDLLTLLSSGKIETYLTRAFEALNEVAKKIDTVIPSYIKNESEGDEKVEAWSESALAVSDFYEKLMHAEKFRMTVYMFVYRVKPVIEGFGKAL